MCTYVKCILFSVIFSNTVLTFNISPNPSLILTQPPIASTIPTVRSSYFGYSINLRTNSILIGAPRAQSTLPDQQAVNETGAIYKCDLGGNCNPFSFDDLGNVEGGNENGLINDFRKDYQWLGASIDGGPEDSDPFIVCAPRLTTQLDPIPCPGDPTIQCNEFISTGMCYKTLNTLDAKPSRVSRIWPLFQINRLEYLYSQMGISIHVTENLEETIIGLPGYDERKGTIVRHRPKEKNDGGGSAQSKRQINNPPRQRAYENDLPISIMGSSTDSYFGYAVTSGYFRGRITDKLLYVASAPQGNDQQGLVYIFEINDQKSDNKTLDIFYTFQSEQMGEYFGYSLVADDFDLDGFTDLAIGAPFYSKDGQRYDNGAVYIYRNLDGKSFVLHAKITSDFIGDGGQFGKSMSKIGDINHDGFNDLLISAPFEDNGAVYVYLGGQSGLSQRPSQRITPPTQIIIKESESSSAMFGLGLSRGLDIDGNNFPDFLIGSPNSEQVFLYKTYPVAKIIATITPNIKDISMTNSEFNLQICWKLISDFDLPQTNDVGLEIILDNLHGRATFLNQIMSIEMNETIGNVEKCKEMKVFVKYNTTDIFNPIYIEMKYNLLNGISEDPSTTFCSNCIAIDPNDPTSVNTKLVFNTGCKNEVCIADLRLSSTVQAPLPYIIGSTKHLDILYKITNRGETAFLTKLKIIIPLMVSFMKIPPSCHLNSSELLCDINSGRPLYVDEISEFTLCLDTTRLDGSSLTVLAEVSSVGDEANHLDNLNENIIPLGEFNNIEIYGKSSKNFISLEDGLDMVDIFHVFEIRNGGPSTIKNNEIIISIPISLRDPWSLGYTDLINLEDIDALCIYNNQNKLPTWEKNNQTILKNYDTDDILSSSTSPFLISGTGGLSDPINPIENQNGMDFDASKINLEYDLSGGNGGGGAGSIDQSQPSYDDNNNFLPQRRRRRSQTMENSNENHHHILRRSITVKNDVMLNNLPVHRRYFFECNDQSTDLCLKARFSVHNFQPGPNTILISLNITLDLKKFDKVVTKEQDLFVLKTSAQIIKTNDQDGKTMEILESPPYTIISKFHEKSTPIWVWILSALGGILLLVLITFGMYKLGFFNRLKKEEMESLKRENQPLASIAASSSRDHYD